MTKTKNPYSITVFTCYLAYVVQAATLNFLPLLFYFFNTKYDISLGEISLLVSINFVTQILSDLISVKLMDKIGYRAGAVAANVFALLGFVALAILPDVLPVPYVGLCISICLCSVGSGLLEVIIGPIVEACPIEGNKEMHMSMLHSAYSWGSVIVVLGSTLFFAIFGVEAWPVMAILWGIVPAVVTVLFSKVPIRTLAESGKGGMTVRQIIKAPVFWALVLTMLCAGASEMAVAQWASSFAEAGLGVSKTVGDLAGPMMFAVMMGLVRTLYGMFGDKIRMEKFLIYSGLLCVASYLMITLTSSSVVGLIGCALCGVAVAAMWPGTCSIAIGTITKGGTALFSMLAIFGDIGCISGPGLVGFVSDAASGNLKVGILSAVIFPVGLLVGVVGISLSKRKQAKKTRVICK